jgi:ribosome-binding ATPase YchF (GTP1/OBG family)
MEKRKDNLQKDIRRGDKDAVKESEILEVAIKIVSDGKLLSSQKWKEEENRILKMLGLLSIKPILYILNKKHGGKNVEETDERFTELVQYIKDTNAEYVVVDAKIEDELKDFEGEEKEMFRTEMAGGVTDDGINTLIKQAYKLLGLETYFTTGEQETRAWTINKGSTAPQAGAAIHTDFLTKFIKAEVIFWSDLLEAGSFGKARETGKLRTEGKEYIVKDGDVMEFKV